ncbi:MAG: tetratricopeptide repeat protein [Anaerolineae bacterium]|nr:tetratricopeptide repeat protein [Anaerolineae bacterium]
MKLLISLLGSFQVTLDERPVTRFETDATRALLAYLAANAGTPFRRDALATLLWPDFDESRALHNLRQTLLRLRTAIEDPAATPPFLQVTRRTLQFDTASHHWLDVAAFDALVASTKRHHHRHLDVCRFCIGQLEHAANLYRGEFLTGFSIDSVQFMEWAAVRRERLHRQAMDVFFTLAGYYEARGAFERAQLYARRQIELEPWREEAHRQLMRVLALGGERSAALAQYDLCREMLTKSLGVEPAMETTLLFKKIEAGEPPGLFLALPALLEGHHLPSPPTPLVGREAELEALTARLLDPSYRLMTVVGGSGIGKTRLALAAAHLVAQQFPHGVWFVDVARAPDTHDALTLATAHALGVALSGRQPPQRELVDFLRDKETLLVLDGMDTRIEAGVTFLLALLSGAPGVTVLATSQERLNLQAEAVTRLAGLPVPESELDPAAAAAGSVRLFAERTTRTGNGFVLDADTLPWTIRICQAVAGSPLGIELAAACTETLPVQEVARRVLANLDALATTMHDVPPRHHSLRAAFEAARSRLDAQEQQALAALSVFAGTFDEAAATAVAGTRGATLLSLADKSLLERAADGTYTLPSLAHQFALAQLAARGEEEAVRERHSAYYLGLVADTKGALRKLGAKQAILHIEAALAEVRQGWEWAVKHAQYAALDRGMEALARFYQLSGLFREGEATFGASVSQLQARVAGDGDAAGTWRVGWMQVALARFLIAQDRHAQAQAVLEATTHIVEAPPPALQAAIQLEWGQALRMQGAHDAARAHVERGLALARADGLRHWEARGLFELAAIAYHTVALEQSQMYAEQALAIYRQIREQRWEALTLTHLGAVAQRRAEYDQAEAHYHQSVQMFRDIGDTVSERDALLKLGTVLSARGLYDRALAYGEQALHGFRASGQRFGECTALMHVGEVYFHLGDTHTALNCLEPALQIGREAAYRELEGHVLLRLGWIAQAVGQPEVAEAYLKRSVTLCHETGDVQCLQEALAALGRALAAQGWRGEARAAYLEALEMDAASGSRAGRATALAGLARLAVDEARVAEAVSVTSHLLDELADWPGLEGLPQPFEVYWSAYEVLRAGEDRRAGEVLNRAYTLLQERAARIADERLRRSFMERVPTHRKIVRAGEVLLRK